MKVLLKNIESYSKKLSKNTKNNVREYKSRKRKHLSDITLKIRVLSDLKAKKE